MTLSIRISKKLDEKLEKKAIGSIVLARILAEKCELKKSEEVYSEALETAKEAGSLICVAESVSGLLRIAGEALDEKKMQRWEQELDQLISEHRESIPPLVWYCKGAIARNREQYRLAQRCFHRYLKLVRRSESDVAGETGRSRDEVVARAWIMLSAVQLQRKKVKRAEWLLHEVLKRYEVKKFPVINGTTYLLLAELANAKKEYPSAQLWLEKAEENFLCEHNWYYHLDVLYQYARLARFQQNYPQAYWYLNLISKIAAGSEFGKLKRRVSIEVAALQTDAVDLLIDSRKGIVRTRESRKISLRKQYILLNILEALFDAYNRGGNDNERGLSKAEIIEKVWQESYRPEAHDNKLYYNINRLRKLIEPDMKQPQYLINWKEGYQLAPGLKVQLVNTKEHKLEQTH